MTYVVGENCIKCKHTACVDVCPTDAFHEGPNFLVINPIACIDCNLCPAECPVDAIFSEDEIPDGQEAFLQLNADLSLQWPVIEDSISPPVDYEKWNGVENKIDLLEI